MINYVFTNVCLRVYLTLLLDSFQFARNLPAGCMTIPDNYQEQSYLAMSL